MTSQKSRIDIHETVTTKIIAAIAAGAGEWKMPWHRPGTSFSIPRNATTDKTYRGINVLSLWIDANEKQFEHQLWATYKQWHELGAQVRAGEKASLIVKYGEWTPKDSPEPEPGADPLTRVYARPAWVFNVAQVDGYEASPILQRVDLTTKIDHVERFIANTRAEFRIGGQRACYRQRSSTGDGDYIQIPELDLFIGTATSTPTEALYATKLHELTHWSGADHRLNRQLGKRFGDAWYAAEELCAELGAAALCAHLGITNEPRPDHAQYVAHWLALLQDDNRAIFTASALAAKAVEYLFDLQPKTAEAAA